MPNSKPIGPTASAGGSVTDGWKARKYIRITLYFCEHFIFALTRESLGFAKINFLVL